MLCHDVVTGPFGQAKTTSDDTSGLIRAIVPTLERDCWSGLILKIIDRRFNVCRLIWRDRRHRSSGVPGFFWLRGHADPAATRNVVHPYVGQRSVELTH